MMYMKLKNHQFKKCLDYLDNNPKWLEDLDNKDSTGKPINYVQVIETIWGIVKSVSYTHLTLPTICSV